MPTLLEVVAQLSTFGPEHVIFVARPWSPAALAAVVGPPAPDGTSAGTDAPEGLDRLVDVADALDFFSGGWADGLDDEARCERLIQYATYDT